LKQFRLGCLFALLHSKLLVFNPVPLVQLGRRVFPALLVQQVQLVSKAHKAIPARWGQQVIPALVAQQAQLVRLAQQVQ
jgi:hypothetical protein